MAKLLATTPQIAFLLTVFIQAVMVLAMAGMAFKLVRTNLNFQDPLQQPKYTTISCYLALFIVAQVLEFVIAFDALRLRNLSQVIDILLLHPALVALAVVHVSQIKAILIFSGLLPGQCYKLFGFDACERYDSLWKQVEPYLIAVPSILFAAWVSMLFWAIKLYSEFRSSSDSLKTTDSKFVTEAASQTYQVAVCMLKISFFCFIGVLSQILIADVPSDTIDFGLAIGMAPVVFIILLVLIFAMTRTWIWLIAASRLLMLGGMGYLAYMVTRIFTNEDVWYLLMIQTNITFFIAILLLALFVVFGMSVRPLVANLIRVLVRFITRAT